MIRSALYIGFNGVTVWRNADSVYWRGYLWKIPVLKRPIKGLF